MPIPIWQSDFSTFSAHLSGVKPRAGFLKFARPLNLEHQIAAIYIFLKQWGGGHLGTECAKSDHDEEKFVGGLEGAVEGGQKGVLGGQRENALLAHRALHVVVLQDDVLLQHFDCVHFVRSLPLSQHHLKGHEMLEMTFRESGEKEGSPKWLFAYFRIA